MCCSLMGSLIPDGIIDPCWDLLPGRAASPLLQGEMLQELRKNIPWLSLPCSSVEILEFREDQSCAEHRAELSCSPALGRNTASCTGCKRLMPLDWAQSSA